MNELSLRWRGGLVAGGLFVALAAACTASPPPPAPPVRGPVAVGPSVVAPAAPSAPVSAADAGADAARPEPPEPPAPAWTDAVHVAGLARDCAYTPPDFTRPKNVDRDFWEGSPLSCGYGLYGQSCSVDPCFDEQKDVCGAKCEKTCDGCGTSCAATCKTCKTACKKDDTACASACATSCASCRQECVLAKDRCATGTCAKRYQECKKETQAKWDSSGCGKGCRAYYDCANACPDGNQGIGSRCGKACEKHLKPCTPGFRGACLFNGGLYGPFGED